MRKHELGSRSFLVPLFLALGTVGACGEPTTQPERLATGVSARDATGAHARPETHAAVAGPASSRRDVRSWDDPASEASRPPKKRFVLVHGAWHGGWCWDGVARYLEAQGHTALAPTLPGNAPGEDRTGVTFTAYVDALVRLIEEQPEPVVLVGHSSAGFLLQAVAPLVREKIERLIFLNAFILAPGMSQFDVIGPDIAQGLIALAGASPDQSVPVLEDFVRNVLMAGEKRSAQDAVLARLVPQALTLFTTRPDIAAFGELAVPRSVVFCKDDVSLPPGAYLGMAERLGEFDLIEVPGSHEALVTHPERVAQAIARAALGKGMAREP